jgi:acyl dehydratase
VTGAGADRPLDEIELRGTPGLGGLSARGLAESVRLVAAGRLGRTPGALPDIAYVATGIRADADRLTAYQHLLGESASDVLPAGFVHALAFPFATAVMVRPGFPLPLVGMVHLANHVTQLRPVSLGDSLGVRAWAQHLAPHRLGTQVELVTEVRVGGGHDASAGSVAWRGVSTYLATGVRLGSEARPHGVGEPGAPGSPGARVPFTPPTPTGQWRLAADIGRRYAAVSGDRNPIHLSALTAKAFGFPRAIAHGMYTASRALAVVGAARGDAFTWTVEFAKPVLLPGTVTVRIAPEPDASTDGGPQPAVGPAYGFAGWSARSGKPHFTGTVRPVG